MYIFQFTYSLSPSLHVFHLFLMVSLHSLWLENFDNTGLIVKFKLLVIKLPSFIIAIGNSMCIVAYRLICTIMLKKKDLY